MSRYECRNPACAAYTMAIEADKETACHCCGAPMLSSSTEAGSALVRQVASTITKLQQEVVELGHERDDVQRRLAAFGGPAVLAHMQRLQSLGWRAQNRLALMEGKQNAGSGLSELMQELTDALDAAPETSFAELEAQVISGLRFPTMLRKMWSGGEVQAWLEEQADAHRARAARPQREVVNADPGEEE